MIRRSFVALMLAGSVFVAAQAPIARTDDWLTRPVDDRTFKTYLDFFTYDRRVPFELKVLDTTAREGIRKEHLSFQSTPGVRVVANLYQPVGPAARNLPAIVFLHGAGIGGKDSRPSVLMSETLTRAGYTVLAIDQQYWGERSTDLLATFTEQEKHEKLYNQPSMYLGWVAQNAKDVGRSFDLLVEQRGVDPKRIGLFGTSRGAILGSIIGAVDRRFAAVVLNLGAHFDALERGHLPAACPANYIGRISPRPLLMLNGLYDQDHIRETSVEPLYRLARAPKEILWSEAGHAPPSEKNQTAMLQWMRAHIR